MNVIKIKEGKNNGIKKRNKNNDKFNYIVKFFV